jgi:hypothetical protein
MKAGTPSKDTQFDNSVDGRTAGMLSVHGETGEIRMDTWHGSSVAEKEMEI